MSGMDLVRYLPEYQALVCRSCRYALQRDHQVSYLVGSPHHIVRDKAIQMLQPFKNLPLVDAKDGSLILPAPESPPIEDLEIFKHGFACGYDECQLSACQRGGWRTTADMSTDGRKAGSDENESMQC